MAEKLKIEVKVVGADKAKNSLSGIGKTAKMAGGDLDSLSKSMSGIQKSVSGLNSSFKAFLGFQIFQASLEGIISIGQSVIGTLQDIGQQALEVGSFFEQTGIAFKTLIGQEASSKLLTQLTDFAKTTPFELREITTASKKLLAYGVSAEEVVPTLERLGNISAGLGAETFGPLIRAFGQVKAKGKLSAQELNLQFSEAGVPLRDQLQKDLGITGEQLDKLVSQGKIGFNEMNRSLENLANNKFGNLMAQQSDTFAGRMSNLKDVIDITLASLVGVGADGVVAEGSIIDIATKGLAELTSFIEANAPIIREFINGVVAAFTQNWPKIRAVIEDEVLPAVMGVIGAITGNKTAVVGDTEEMAEALGTGLADSVVILAQGITFLADSLAGLIRVARSVKRTIEPLMPLLRTLQNVATLGVSESIQAQFAPPGSGGGTAGRPGGGRAFGGVIPGNSRVGDKMLVRANSGEMVLTQQDQKGLMSLIREVSNGGSVNNNFNAPISFGGGRPQAQEMNMFGDLLSKMSG